MDIVQIFQFFNYALALYALPVSLLQNVLERGKINVQFL